ncbi:hypothetical protein RDWZM_007492 [Blomia tropicalis]|uniref:Uncharacterized protein n=1 Tax=Blomia tropicalis TaxID=40697 RepID=A0A9Q0M2L1_BLOTA|nr:hypothetical protein RDWZM_007492 [Blomia tropicalis]
MSTNGVSVTLLVDHVIMLNHTIRFVLVVSLCCMAATTVNSQDPIFGNVVEGYVKDLFTKELSGSEQQNVTGCMARLLCENICQRAMNGEIKGQPLLQTAKMLGRTEEDPLGYLVTGGDRGYELAQTKQCNQCADKYPNCLPGQYDQVKTMSDRYERDMIKGAGSSVDTEFMPFK